MKTPRTSERKTGQKGKEMSDSEQGENAGMKALTIEEIAASAFEANERVKMLMAMNQPSDYEERKKAFIEMSVARAEANKWNNMLMHRVGAGQMVGGLIGAGSLPQYGLNFMKTNI